MLVHVVFEMGLAFPFVYLVFVHEAAGSVVVLVVFFLSVWVCSDLVGFGHELVMLVIGAPRVRHFHVALLCTSCSLCIGEWVRLL